jgi:hypothetical protein
MSRKSKPVAGEINRQAEVQYFLRRAVAVEGLSLAAGHVWASEGDRWAELVFALLTCVTSVPHPVVRALADQLNDAGLLEVGALAEIQQAKGQGAPPDVHARSIVECLQEGGFAQEEARRGLEAMCEAALSLQQHFDGKVQRYLRRYGEQMIGELDGFFHFTTLDADAVRAAFSYWLQNVLNMPLPLVDERVTEARQRVGLRLDELVEAADELGINVALVDDVVLSYDARRAAGGLTPEQTEG